MNNFKKEEICFVSCYFNPCNYKSRFFNFLLFLESVVKTKTNVLVVEAFSKESKYRINKLYKNVISINTSERYWMKECLINLGIKHLLYQKIKYIGWLDCDIVLSEKFQDNVLVALKRNKCVQVFSECKKITSEYSHIQGTSICKISKSNINLQELLINRIGDVGYGFAYHSSILNSSLLYDKSIVGTGDWLNILGLIKITNIKELYNDRFFRGTTIDFFNSFKVWHNKMSSLVNGSVGFADNKILVLQHGHERDRHYVAREKIIKSCKFHPSTDLVFNKSIYTLVNKNLQYEIDNYFKIRKEDSTILSSTEDKVNTILKSYRFYNKNQDILYILNSDNYIDVRKRINDFEYDFKSNDNKIIKTKNNQKKEKEDFVLSRHTDSKLLPMSFNDTFNITMYRKRGNLKKNEVVLLSHRDSISHTYLTHIIKNYKTLSNKILFLNDLYYTPDEIYETVETSLSNSKKIAKKKYKISESQSERINNFIIKNLGLSPSTYSSYTDVFLTSNNNIYRKSLDFYINLLKLSNDYDTDFIEKVYLTILGIIL
jgi:hypothetical protein